MRVLLSGGKKTHNIIEGIRKNFTTSGDDFVVIEYIDNIMDMFARGEYFDKAIITEQSITKDGEITDEMIMRSRINDFAVNMSKKPSKNSYIFLAQNEEMASIIYDEVLPISNDSAVVCKQPPYKVTFFVDLIVKESLELPTDWIYEPELAVPEGIDLGLTEDTESDIEASDMELGLELPEMPTNTMFDNDLGEFTDTTGRVSDGLQINGGQEFDSMGTPANFNELIDSELGDGFDGLSGSTESFGNNFDGGFSNSNEDFNGSFEEDLQPVIDTDETIETDLMEPIKQSSELPDYTEVQPEKFLPGFDDEPTEQVQSDNNDTFGSELYGDTQNQGFDSSTYEAEPVSNENSMQGFGADLYSDSQNPENSEVYTNPEQGFSNDMYGETPVTNNDDTSAFGADLYENTETPVDNSEYSNTGFDGNMYNNVQSDNYQATMESDMYNGVPSGININKQATVQKNQPTMPVKKRGIRGLLSKGNNQQQYQNMVGQLNDAQPVSSWQQDQAMVNNNRGNNSHDINNIKQLLKPFASRGNSIVVTGCGGCGTSTVAYNLANIVNQLGYSVLLVDFDTEGKTQSYISKANYDSMESDGANLMSAVNSSSGITAHESIVKQGFHLLTMGLGADIAPVEELIHKEKISRFVNLTKSSHNFIIYDVPFESATGFLAEITYMADNLVLVADASNWGITKMMIDVCNISLEDMQDTIFSRAQLIFNRYRNLTKLLGKKVRTGIDITKVIDLKVQELVGEDPGFHFEDLHIAGIINDDPEFENCWFENVQYSDSQKGQSIFIELLEHIVLKK